MPQTYVYRSGIPTAPTQRGCEASVYATADSLRPAGHPTRTHGIFASPTLTGVTRWVRGNASVGMRDVRVRQIAVNPDTAMVYSVRAWEVASSWETPEGHGAFWATGMTLTDWLTRDLDPSEWEVILRPEDILSVRPVSDARVAAAAPDGWDRETKNALARKGHYRAR